MTPPPKLERIGRYQVLEKVGKGGMGVLYRGFDPVLDREVAIKLMHADFSEDTEQMRPRFYREARAAAKLNHRNIVTIFEFAEESNVPYIVMEFLKGLPLGARLHSQPPLTLDDKLNVIAQLCDGLAYAHEQGVVHRDVKPDNVFLLEDGSVKLLDFGIAKLTTSTLTRQGDVLGSASYMSPEQVGGSDSVDGRADVFSTGVVLYELLSGRKPFEGDSPTAVIVKILKEDPTPIETVTTGLPADVTAVVMRALQKNPADRYQSADALGRDLQTVRKSLHPSMSRGNMDETRFASVELMKALHDDYQKNQGTGGRSDTALGTARTIAPGAGTAPTMAGLAPTMAPGMGPIPIMSPGTPGATGIGTAPTMAPGGVMAPPQAPMPPPTAPMMAQGTAVITAAEPVRTNERSWLVPALVGALIAVIGVGGFVLYSGRQPAADPSTQALTEPAPGAIGGAPTAAPATEPAIVAQAGAVPAAPIDPAPIAAAVPAAVAPVAVIQDPTPAVVPTVPPVAPRVERPAPVTAPPVSEPAASTATRPADVASPARGATADSAEAATSTPTGTLFIDFVSGYPDGSVEVEIDGRRRWSEKLGLSQNVGGLSRLKMQRSSEQLGSELKVPAGNHRIAVTVLNADGEVRDIGTTSVSIYASKAATLRIRQTRLRNKLQLETVAGEPDGK